MIKWLMTITTMLFHGITWCQPLPNSHAHNDYEKDEPLFRALRNGFISLEVDVFLHQQKLIVSHIPFMLFMKPTLQDLYLTPLHNIISENKGSVYPDFSEPVVLMIDIKRDGEQTYVALKKALQPYNSMLTTYRNDSIIQGPIEINLSGNCPLALLKQDKERWATADLSIEKGLDSTLSHILVKRVSSPYRKYFKWRGMGVQPMDEKMRLDSLVAQAHRQQKQIRFYAAPNKRKVWNTLLDSGVDWINVDRVKRFRKFYENRKQKKNCQMCRSAW